MSNIWKVRLKVGGKMYTFLLDDGHVDYIRLPDGKVVYELPPALARHPRVERFLRREQEKIRDMRAALDEERFRSEK